MWKMQKNKRPTIRSKISNFRAQTTGKMANYTDFRDNFSSLEKNSKSSNVLLDASWEIHIMWKNSCLELDTSVSNRLQSG